MKRSEPNVSSFLFILTAAVTLWIFPFFYPADSGRTGQSQTKEPAFYTLTLHVDYHYGAQESFEVCRDLLVSADEGFTSTFRPFVRQYSGNHAVYTYRSEEPFTKVYVKPPSVCLSTEIIPIIVSMSEGKRRAELDGQEWFTVSSVDTKKTAKEFLISRSPSPPPRIRMPTRLKRCCFSITPRCRAAALTIWKIPEAAESLLPELSRSNIMVRLKTISRRILTGQNLS